MSSVKQRMGKQKYILWILMSALLILWVLWANTALECNTITITSERLPKTFDGYRIVQISDLHNAEVNSMRRIWTLTTSQQI